MKILALVLLLSSLVHADQFDERQSILEALLKSPVLKSAIVSLGESGSGTIDQIRHSHGLLEVDSGRCTLLIKRNTDQTFEVFSQDCDQVLECTKAGADISAHFQYVRKHRPEFGRSFIVIYNNKNSTTNRYSCEVPATLTPQHLDQKHIRFTCGNASAPIFIFAQEIVDSQKNERHLEYSLNINESRNNPSLSDLQCR